MNQRHVNANQKDLVNISKRSTFNSKLTKYFICKLAQKLTLIIAILAIGLVRVPTTIILLLLTSRLSLNRSPTGNSVVIRLLRIQHTIADISIVRAGRSGGWGGQCWVLFVLIRWYVRGIRRFAIRWWWPEKGLSIEVIWLSYTRCLYQRVHLLRELRDVAIESIWVLI